MTVNEGSMFATENDVDSESLEWKYRSAFTFASYNDLDRMGYEVPKRFPKHRGARYSRYHYSQSAAVQTEGNTEGVRESYIVELVCVTVAVVIVVVTLPISLLFTLKFIDDFERLVVLRLGRAQKTRGPGATVVLPCIDTYTKVDLRVNAFHVPPMQIITADHGLVELGATVYQQVKDALAAVCSVQERNHSTRILASTTLHRLVCKRSVSEISSGARRRELAAMLQDELAELTLSWGVDILKVELSDVKVIKDGENMAISALKTVMKSDFGNAILSSLGDSINEFIEEAKSNVSTDREETLPAEVGSNSESNLKMTAEVLSKRPLLTLDDLICTISMVIDESLVHQVGRVFQVDCKGLGEFFIDLKNGEGKCAIGRYSSADVVLQLDVSVFYDIIRQKVSPTQAYMNGSLHVIGPVHLAMNLSHLANRLSRLN